MTPTAEKGGGTTPQDKTNKPLVEELAEAAARDLCELLADHDALALQERDIYLAQRMVDNAVEDIRKQLESEAELTRELLDAAEKQLDALPILVWESARS